MKRTKSLLIILGASLLAMMTGCDKDQDSVDATGNGEIKIRTAVAEQITRTAPDTDIAAGQIVGVTVVEDATVASMTYTPNTQYTADGSGSLTITNQTELQYYPQNGNGIKITAYHPYSASGTAAFDFSVQEDQSVNANYYASDLLFSPQTAYSSSVTPQLTFTHKLSKIAYTMEAGPDGYQNATVKVAGMQTNVSFDPATGAVGDPAAAKEYKTITLNSSYGAVVAPQTVAAGTQLFQVTLSGVTYKSVALASPLTFNPGEKYSYKISISGGELIVSDAEVVAWGTAGTNESGTAVAQTPTVTYSPTFSEVGNTVTVAGTLLTKVDDVTFNGKDYSVNAATDGTSLTIDFSTATAADAAANQNLIFNYGSKNVTVNNFSLVNSVVWDGNFENVSSLTFDVSGGAGKFDSASAAIWHGLTEAATNYSISLDSDTEQGNHILFKNVTTGNSSWYRAALGQRIELSDLALGEYRISFKAKANKTGTVTPRLRTTIVLRKSTGNVSNCVIISGQESQASYPYYQVDPNLSTWTQYSQLFDTNYYVVNMSTSAAGSSTTLADYDYALIWFWFVAEGEYWIDDVQLVKQ